MRFDLLVLKIVEHSEETQLSIVGGFFRGNLGLEGFSAKSMVCGYSMLVYNPCATQFSVSRIA